MGGSVGGVSRWESVEEMGGLESGRIEHGDVEGSGVGGMVKWDGLEGVSGRVWAGPT